MNKPSLTSADKPFDMRMLQASTKLGRGLLGDLCGTNYAAKGSVWHYGLGGSKLATKDPSMMGVFTNDYGDSITMVWDHTDQFRTITSTLAGATKIYDFGFFVTSVINSEEAARKRDAERVCGLVEHVRINMRTNGSGWAEEAATAVADKVTWLLQRIGDFHKYDRSAKRILIVLHRDSPYTWKNVSADALTFLEVAAVIASVAVPAIPKDVIASCQKVISSFKNTGKCNVQDLVKAGLSIAPESLRQNEYVAKATNIYNKYDRGDYRGAAQELGIDVAGALESFKKTCDWTEISKNAKVGFDTAVGSLQNYLNCDVVSKFAGKMRTGTFVKEVIENGTITGFKEFQDAILGGISASTVMTLLPDPPQLVKTLIHETNNLRDNDVFRAFLGIANGISTGDNVLDELSIEAISSRVNSILQERYQSGIKNLEYSLTTAIDKNKREYIAQEVSKNTGARVLTSLSGMQTSNNLRKALPYIAIGTAGVAGLTYFYSRK